MGIEVTEVPHAAIVLGDLGADVVRIERAGNGVAPVPNPREDHLLRNRRWVQANLKDSEDRDRVLRLISHADALIEGYRPGVTERLGLGQEAAPASRLSDTSRRTTSTCARYIAATGCPRPMPNYSRPGRTHCERRRGPRHRHRAASNRSGPTSFEAFATREWGRAPELASTAP